jgi:hypothetical protein
MPAKKPHSLNTRAETKAQRNARIAAESAASPKTLLSKRPPAIFKDHAQARKTWKRLIDLYAETEGTIITAFDEDLLIKYCLAEEELGELFDLRSEIKKLWTAHAKLLAKIHPKPDQFKDYFNTLSQANALLQRFQGMDARMDGKRKFVFSLSQSLYLTPRSRAGVAPQAKEHDKPKSETDKILDD